MAKLYEKVRALGGGIFKNGLDIVLTENANNFSGGERQRLAIARAVVKNVDFYIFDEATSAMDGQTAVKIEAKFLTNPDFTVIFVTHRLYEKVITLYDEIIVFDSGRIVENGSFETLINLQGSFYKQYRERGNLWVTFDESTL